MAAAVCAAAAAAIGLLLPEVAAASELAIRLSALYGTAAAAAAGPRADAAGPRPDTKPLRVGLAWRLPP